jgi:SulP family sulfate permease
MIAAMLAGSVAGLLLNHLFGAATTQIRTVGALPASLPPLSVPDLSLITIRHLADSALAVTLLALTEAVSIARAIAVRSEQRIDGNQEFVGQGLANIVGAFFSSYASSGSFNRSGVNYEAGAKTPLAAVFASLFLAVILLLVAPLAAYLPVAAMAGILFLVAWGLIDFHHIRRILRASRSETAVLATTFLATLFVELEFAIYVGVIFSLVLYLKRTSKPLVRAMAPDPEQPRRRMVHVYDLPECPQLRIMEVHGSLFFGAVNHVQERLHAMDEANPEQKHVLILADSINFIDIAGAEMLVQEAKRRRRLGGGLYLSGMKERACEVLKRSDYFDEFGPENIFEGKTKAIASIFERLDRDICQRCNKRIFRECASVPQQTVVVSA